MKPRAIHMLVHSCSRAEHLVRGCFTVDGMSLATLALTSGRHIDLHHVEVFRTYGGMVDGVPTVHTNDRKLAHLVKRARSERGRPVHLVQPPRRTLASTNWRREYQELLPPVTCVGYFESAPVNIGTDDPSAMSVLTVIWFQEAFASPFSAEALPALSAIPWTDCAEDATC
jgi:hypothetical protein